jgi:CRISPR-associated protein Cmr4
MNKTEKTSLIKLYAVSPVHAGSGASLAAVDLPIQRERHTNWPHIQASGVKGAMRSHFRRFNESDGGTGRDVKYLANIVFGSDEQDGWNSSADGDTLPGAISVSDAKLFAFPVRSNMAPFVWVTSPAVLKRLKTDLEIAGIKADFKVPAVEGDKAMPFFANAPERLVIEDAAVACGEKGELKGLEILLSGIDRLLLVSDMMYDYCVSSCTEVQAQIKIDEKNGTAKDGALRYQELLPSDSVMYSIVCFGAQNFENEFQADMIEGYVKKVFCNDGFIQVGGDVTLGRGVCRINWIEGGE